jgi:hypothetical protein
MCSVCFGLMISYPRRPGEGMLTGNPHRHESALEIMILRWTTVFMLPFHIVNRLTDFYENWYEYCFIRGNPTSCLANSCVLQYQRDEQVHFLSCFTETSYLVYLHATPSKRCKSCVLPRALIIKSAELRHYWQVSSWSDAKEFLAFCVTRRFISSFRWDNQR